MKAVYPPEPGLKYRCRKAKSLLINQYFIYFLTLLTETGSGICIWIESRSLWEGRVLQEKKKKAWKYLQFVSQFFPTPTLIQTQIPALINSNLSDRCEFQTHFLWSQDWCFLGYSKTEEFLRLAPILNMAPVMVGNFSAPSCFTTPVSEVWLCGDALILILRTVIRGISKGN